MVAPPDIGIPKLLAPAPNPVKVELVLAVLPNPPNVAPGAPELALLNGDGVLILGPPNPPLDALDCPKEFVNGENPPKDGV